MLCLKLHVAATPDYGRTTPELGEHFKHTGITMHVYISGKELKLMNNMKRRPLTDDHIAEIIVY